MNTYLKYQPAGVQFVAFLGFAAGFFVLNGILLTTLFSDIALAVADKQVPISPELVVKFKWAQLLGAILTFIAPALLFGYYSSPKALPYVGLQRRLSPLLVLASILLLLTVQPFVGWLGDLNSKISFGSFQKTMEEAEANYTRMLQSFLQMKNLGAMLINLVIMALLPAIGEELFFRGAFQKALLRLSHQPWLAILVSAIVFTVLHGTIFKFIPIFTLGIILGTIYHVTRNLWYTIIIHFLNNALAVLAVYFSTRVPFLQKLANDDLRISWYMAIGSLLIAVAIILFMQKKSDELLPAHVTDDDNDYIA
jgi:uncharacterized protein